MLCQREKVGAGDLLMALQLAGNGSECFRDGKILDPEVMVLMREVRRKKNESISRDSASREIDGVRDQPNRPKLRNRACGPTPVAPRLRPSMRGFMMLVSRP